MSSMGLDGIRSWQVVLFAGFVRAALICWAEYQDQHLPVKYTDIDYVVFTDAARYVAAGESPYQRATYRYSPLLAYLLLPNVWLHPAWGKVLFSAADLAAAGLMHLLLLRSGSSQRERAAALALWLFNPYTATISTRGSCDVLSVLLMLGLLVCLLYGRSLISGALYGVAVHFRIYPVIYGPAIALFLMRRALLLMQGARGSPCHPAGSMATDGVDATARVAAAAAVAAAPLPGGRASGLRQRHQAHDSMKHAVPRPLPPAECAGGDTGVGAAGGSGGHQVTAAAVAAAAVGPAALFGTAAAASFILLGAVFYNLYGTIFLQEAFLHHLTRKDPRHNFSPYYYPVYLSYGSTAEYRDGRGGAAAAAAATGGSDGASASPLRLMLLAWNAVRRVVPVDEPWRLAMVPQAAALLTLGFRFYEDLPAAWLLQTWCFVTFNKVVTAQYFVWYLSFLPLVLPALAAQRAVRCTVLFAGGGVWVAAQLLWLAWAYQLEMRGRSVHLSLWAASLVFLVANTVMLVLLIRALCWRLRRSGGAAADSGGHADDLPAADGGGSGGGMTFLEASLALSQPALHAGCWTAAAEEHAPASQASPASCVLQSNTEWEMTQRGQGVIET